MLEFALFLTFPAAMAFAGSMDLLTMTIPNRISIALIAAFGVALPFSGLDLSGVASHVGAGLLMLAVGIVMFSQGWFGGGDAKLMAAASLWVGLEYLMTYLLCVAVAGGLLVIAILLYRQIVLPPSLMQVEWATRLHAKAGGVPYGIALAAGGLWVYPQTPWFAALAV